MLNESRIDIYDYLYGLLYDNVTKNVYSMNEPQELTESDAKDGFVVIRVGDIYDESEFNGQAYGWVRCYVQAYVPTISRGRLDYDRYKEFESGINDAIDVATMDTDNTYFVEKGSVLSMDGFEMSNANNAYYTFVKSFIVNIDKQL